MSAAAPVNFEIFAKAFVRAYWESVRSDAFPMPPNEPVEESLEQLLSVISLQTEFRREIGLHVLRMENTLGAWWEFSFRASAGHWELAAASARSDSPTPHDLLGPVYSQYFEPMLRHVEKAANDRMSDR